MIITTDCSLHHILASYPQNISKDLKIGCMPCYHSADTDTVGTPYNMLGSKKSPTVLYGNPW